MRSILELSSDHPLIQDGRMQSTHDSVGMTCVFIDAKPKDGHMGTNLNTI